jgi:GNAT superfamily N-acetyltransferase
MNRLDHGSHSQTKESELFYLHIPTAPRPVGNDVEFLSASEFLESETDCRSLWNMITAHFKTRSKFLAIWPSVRFVAAHHRGGELVGFLLVSAPVNWQIDYVVVRPEWRGHGIAESLVKATLNEALARKAPFVMLTSRPGLRPLYESACGLTVVTPASESNSAAEPALCATV